MKIIGLAGTNGSGKDTVAAMLAERHGYLIVSATEMFLVELKKRGWPIDREHKSRLSAEWRREFGMGVVVDKAVELFEASKGAYQGIVVGSLRHPGESERVHELGGKVVWVDADPKVRYDRIQGNLAERAGTHVEANKSYEDFLSEEQREMTPSGDSATLNMGAVRDSADIKVDNTGISIESFKDKVEAALGLV